MCIYIYIYIYIYVKGWGLAARPPGMRLAKGDRVVLKGLQATAYYAID